MENQSENLTETKAKANRKMRCWSNRADSHRCSPNKGTRVTSLDRGCFTSCVCFDPIHVVSGGVFCHPDYPVSVSSSLELMILVLDIAVPILPAFRFLLQFNSLKESLIPCGDGGMLSHAVAHVASTIKMYLQVNPMHEKTGSRTPYVALFLKLSREKLKQEEDLNPCRAGATGETGIRSFPPCCNTDLAASCCVRGAGGDEHSEQVMLLRLQKASGRAGSCSCSCCFCDMMPDN